ncbi:helix-turn-helix transcriptional regulator [Proteiniphilum propionicum]|jgi:excisionase family DNA binding protein|uniref:helix-turn-helix transcriptional regulator n=1 Tax=Proteiniphilum propionicum TaxID=2829812 RepID=UPI001EEC5D9C|nr:helix-turn-helix domain-containing protein [Proteiniphilum propionicum]ULB35177.1 helix-turn-helix domain-containing protein [Proteiniphilum propionicum]
MQSLILVNKNDLRELLKEMIPVTNVADPIDEQKDYFSLDEGLSYINERGLTISKSTLYKKTADREIPFQRWGGKKIVFLRDELDQWISKQLSGKEDKVSEITKSVADSARRKERG